MYFNKIAPIGISLRPWRVHQDAYTKRTRDIIAHDFTHIEDSSEFYDHSQYESVRRTYEYILHNQEALGPPGRIKGLITYLFYFIHEVGGFSDDYELDFDSIIDGMLEAIIDGGLTDILPFIIDNDYYTPDRLGYD